MGLDDGEDEDNVCVCVCVVCFYGKICGAEFLMFSIKNSR